VTKPWWQGAVVYQVYIRSFADGNGDGVGDLMGMKEKLPYLRWLGVDAVWITPFYPSPMADHGYDVADYRDVEPTFGTLADFDALVAEAHRLGIRVLNDLVPNHSSDHHRWFQAALSSRENPDRDKYFFRDPSPDGGRPNNWMSVFRGPAWTLHEPTGQYYLHLFTPEQPDLNWRNPKVREDFDSILRFWLDRGVDGFRIDVARGMYKDELLRDNPPAPEDQPEMYAGFNQPYAFNQSESHDVFRRWSDVLNGYPGDRMIVGEVWGDAPDVADFVRPGEMDLAFDFLLMLSPWDAGVFRATIARCLDAYQAVGASAAWVLSNHDWPRQATRYGGGAQGLARARAVALLTLSLPGTVFLYAGEELGLEDVEVPEHLRQDPQFFRSQGEVIGRDGCRIPLPWDESSPNCGFSAAAPWLPMPEGWGKKSVSSLRADPGSILHLYRKALSARRDLLLDTPGNVSWLDAPEGCLAYERDTEAGTLRVACNFTAQPSDLPAAGKLVLASNDAVKCERGVITLPADSAAWVLS